MNASDVDTSLTVVVRTAGDRPELLREALASVADQSVPPDQLVVVWHDIGLGAAPPTSDVVQVVRVVGGARGRPLNTALDAAAGDYVAFLDDDDLALPNWVSTFAEAARANSGQIIRAVAVDRPVLRGDTEVTQVGEDSVPEGRDDPFDYFTMLTRSRTPLCSIALPVQRLRDEGLRFAEDLPVLEDWDFLLRAAPVLGVHDTHEVTSVYRRWQDGIASLDTEGSDVWAETRAEVIRRLDEQDLVLPPGSASRLLALFEREREAKEARAEVAEQEVIARELVRETEALRRRIQQMETSTSWRITAPLRRILDVTLRRR